MPGSVVIQSTANATPTINLYGDSATIEAGVDGIHGIISLKDTGDGSTPGILLNAHNRDLIINRVPVPQKQGIYPVVSFSAATGKAGIGGNGQDGGLGIYAAGTVGSEIHESPSHAMIYLDGKSGDIVLQNADCAEEFEILDPEHAEPGTVMVIGERGGLRMSEQAYDKRVAGVISGANELRPGIVLGRKPSTGARCPVALVGKVFCKVDAHYGAIEVGDLLTSSPTPGHAMRTSDALRSVGAVLGKALLRFEMGQGVIPILVALQ
jgi:hypothetical protein